MLCVLVKAGDNSPEGHFREHAQSSERSSQKHTMHTNSRCQSPFITFKTNFTILLMELQVGYNFAQIYDSILLALGNATQTFPSFQPSR